MGFFFGRSNTHDSVQKHFSRAAIKQVISRTRISSLSKEDELAAEAAIDKARGGDEKISLQQINDALKPLEKERSFTSTDRTGIVRACKIYFDKHN